jgi:hypothetical protein
VSTVVHIQYASGGNGRAVMMVTRAGCAAPTHRDLCILRRKSSTDRYCQMRLIGDGVRCNQQPPIDPRSFEQRTSDGYLLSPSRLHSRRKNARDILSNLRHAIALESVVP